ncbi:MAG: AraC family transcriptional regulator [Turicibacter sp.]|nr:AraC family transcriptional regulator [Turicibacter sp.]
MKLIEHVIFDTYHTTGLSVQFFNTAFHILNSMGTSSLVPTEKVKSDLSGMESMGFLECPHGIHYLAVPFIAPPHPTGYFVIGPFHFGECQVKSISYKPKNCMVYLEDLFESILNKQLAAAPGYDSHTLAAIDYVKQNYHEPITLDDVCEQLSLNKNYFCTLFKNNTGQTFNNYLNHLRVEQAKKLLKASKESIIDISLQVGFNNHTHFSQTFKKLAGLTPTQFRNQPCPVIEGLAALKKGGSTHGQKIREAV